MAGSYSPILWQNEDQTVTLIDIPRSIAAAQGTEEKPCSDVILSCEAIARPHQSQEPKTQRARSNLERNTVDDSKHAEYKHVLESALEQVRNQYDGDWCLARSFVARIDARNTSGKRKLNEDDHPQHRPLSNDRTSRGDSISTAQDNIEGDACPVCADDCPQFQTNCSPDSLHHIVQDTFHGTTISHSFQMPPFSTFYLGDMRQRTSIRDFLGGIRSQASAHDTSRYLDLILMDPPWPNRSVDRANSQSYSGYTTASTLRDVEKLILGMDLDSVMANDAFVGVWITNRPAIRNLVLESIFPQWGLELEEEWIWLKTTVRGEPVSDLDSLWRKPYEILLLGRKVKTGTSTTIDQDDPLKRKVIFGVPDLHSRKPCVKALLEPLLSSHTNYRALEVFSRYLVAGWWSVGDECTKFNEDSNWCKAKHLISHSQKPGHDT